MYPFGSLLPLPSRLVQRGVAPRTMSTPSILPAFLAGFVCAAGVGVLLAQLMYAPFQTELSTTRERLLSQERLHQQELSTARDTAKHAAHLACAQQLADAAADAERRCRAEAIVCPDAAPPPMGSSAAACSWPNDGAALLALLAVAANSSTAVAPPSPPPLDAPPTTSPTTASFTRATDCPRVDVKGSECGACIAASHVVGEAASAKWVLEPARDAGVRPGAVDDVHISYAALPAVPTESGDGARLHGDGARRALFRLAEGDAHAPAVGWSAALRSMAVGERAAFRFAGPPAGVPSPPVLLPGSETDDGAWARGAAAAASTTYEIRLLGMTPVEDLSPQRQLAGTDRPTLLKRVLERGSGSETPADGAKVRIDLTISSRATIAFGASTSEEVAHAAFTTNGPAIAPGSNSSNESSNATSLDARASASAVGKSAPGVVTHNGLELVLGDGLGGEGLRLALLSMTRSESATVTMHPSLAAAPIVSPPGTNTSAPLSNTPLEVTIRLLAFEQPRAVELMSPTELLAHVTRLKTSANHRFANGDTESACGDYERAQRLLRLFDEASAPAGESMAWRSLRLALSLNGAACSLKVGRHDAALAHSDAALALSPSSAKAHFRRGQALNALGKLDEAEAAFKAVLMAEPASREAHAKLAEVQVGRGAHAGGGVTPSEVGTPMGVVGDATPTTVLGASDGPTLVRYEGISAGSDGVTLLSAPQQLDALKIPLVASTKSVATPSTAQVDQSHAGSVVGSRELLERVEALKDEANGHFAAGKTTQACEQYERALQLLLPAGRSDAGTKEARMLQLKLLLNSAACALRAERHEQALAHSDAALILAPNSTKAQFRRGQALQSLGRSRDAAAAYEAVLEAEPASREAHRKLMEVQASM